MKNLRFLKVLGLVCLTGLFQQSMAQTAYKYQANITGIDSSGFYQLSLPPKIIALCKFDLSDIRIVDETGKAVPFVMQKDVPVNYKSSFIAFQTIQTSNDSTTVLLVKSTVTKPIQKLHLFIKNNTVRRKINLSGSDDAKKWYAISEDIPLENNNNTNKDYYEQALPIPQSSYRYYKISVNNKNKASLKIIRAGVYTNEQSSGKYELLPPPSIIQKDSGSMSYITVKFDNTYMINKIHLAVTGAKFFSRNTAFFEVTNGHEHEISDEENFSNSRSDFEVAAKTKELRIVISNEDNPPLKVVSVNPYQLRQALTSYLENGKKYRVIFGYLQAKPPQYDLHFFTDSISKQLKKAAVGNISGNIDYKSPQNIKSNFTYLMWAAIAVILIVLSFFTFKMMNELKSPTTSENN